MNLTQKVGILNFHYSDHNYGAVLQAAAVEHFLKNNGIDAEHIDYISKPAEKQKGIVRQLKDLLKKSGVV